MRKLLVLSLVLLVSGCASRQKGEPGIPDTPEAQAVMAVVNEYVHAIEAKDVDAILSLASENYYGGMGTPSPEDDQEYDDLRRKLQQDLDQVRSLRLDLDVTNLEIDDDGQRAVVDYRYDIRYQLALPSGDVWNNALDVNRMVLRREEGAWRIVSGL